MQTYRVETTIGEDGTVTLKSLPFPVGERVEVIVLTAKRREIPDNEYPLRGTLLRYDRPTDPVAEDDWEALK